MIFNKKIKPVLYALFITLFISCDSFLDVNDDTDNPVVAPIKELVPGIEFSVGRIGDFNLWSGGILQVYTHQLVAREDQDQYNVNPDNTLLNNEWDNIYGVATDIETLINQSELENDLLALGLGQLMKVYIFSCAVDLWGNIPFAEATKLESDEIISPSFQDQKEIYMELFKLIDDAKNNLLASNSNTLGSSDIIYGGDRDKWIRFANSYKLKLYNQIRLTDMFDTPEIQSGFNTLIDENIFFRNLEDDFEFKHTATLQPEDERNNLWLDSYAATQFTTYISPWFYEILIGINPDIHTGILDPRIPYYIVSQLADDEFPRQQGNLETMDPNADYWDESTGFLSIRFGSISPDRDSSIDNDVTHPGIYVTGGLYDDNTGLNARDNTNQGTGAAPKRILTYDELLFIQAELIQADLISGNARQKLNEAIIANFNKVDNVVDVSNVSQSVPLLSNSSDAVGFVTAILNEYDNANDTKKLEIIMTQKWVATFGDPLDQYNDLRRTEYPRIPDPTSTTGEYQLESSSIFSLDDSQTTLNGNFQLSMFWPQNELNSNINAPNQKRPDEYRIFWDVD